MKGKIRGIETQQPECLRQLPKLKQVLDPGIADTDAFLKMETIFPFKKHERNLHGDFSIRSITFADPKIEYTPSIFRGTEA